MAAPAAGEAAADALAAPGWWWALAGGAVVGLTLAGWRCWSRRRVDSAVDRRWRRALAMTDSMVWEAEVRRERDRMAWHFTMVQPSQLYRRLLGDHFPTPERGLWLDLHLPEQAEMDARSTVAMQEGKSGYEQDFRVLAEGRTFWLHETAAIETLGPDKWHVVAVVTDVTARREAEEIARANEQRLERLAGEMHALLWQARVVRRPVGAFDWEVFVPASELLRRLFGEARAVQPVLRWRDLGVPEAAAMEVTAREAILGGRTAYEQEFHVPRETGDIWLREQVAIRPVRDGEWALNGVIVDISQRRREEAQRRAEDANLQRLLSAAHCLLWRGEVRRLENGELSWDVLTSRSALYAEIFGDPPAGTACRLDWHRVAVPENAEIDARGAAAILSGKSGYEQEFRVLLPRRVLWLHEQVTISPAGPDSWNVVGVVVDVTARREAEEARRGHQAQLARILDAVDCILWQARVIDRGDGSLHWILFIPPSRLYRAVFGGEPGELPLFRWERVVDAATDIQMDGMAERAIFGGLRGYSQEFRALCPDRPRWLHEQVAVEPAGPREWNLLGVITDATPRHEAEEAKREHQRQLDKIFDVVDCLLWRAEVEERPDGEQVWLVYVPGSALFHKLFGPAEPDPRTALNWDEANVPEYPEMQRRSAAAIRAGAPGYEQEFRAFVGGKMYWLFERASIKRTAFNRLELVGVVVDVTATRQAEQEVRQSELRFRTLFQHTPVAMVETDFSAAGRWLEGLRATGVADLPTHLASHPRDVWHAAGLVRVVDCNDMTLRVFGAATREELLAKRRRLVMPETLEAVRGTFVALAQGRDAHECEVRLRDLAGRPRQLLVRWWIGRNAAGIDLARSVVVLVDLTDLKRAEAELAAEKERLAVTLRAMAEAVITTDVEGRVRFLNPAAVALTQWPAETAVGRPVAEVCPLREAENETVVPVPFERVLRGDTVAELPVHTTSAARGGGRRAVEGCCAPIHSADSAVVGTVLVFRDITERERLEHELARASKLESVGLLAGGIAHDFNNILTAVIGNLALGLLDVPAETELGAALRDAERAALRARDLTQQLLTFARGGEPIRTAVRLPEIIAEVTRFALHGAKVNAEFDLAPDLWPADVDKAQISRVVQNLAINAVQAMPAGGTVRLAARNVRVRALEVPPLAPGAYVRIAVADTGVGIKPEHLERVFEPYFTTKQTGSGLGLATVYSIVRKHKGHIRVQSALGHGTTFEVYLPAAEEAAPAAEADLPPARGGANGRVLFMDDEAPIRRLATALLRRLGSEVEVVADGQAAVERFAAARAAGRPFDVVIMDLTVPGGMGGLEALERLRAIDPAVRAIVSSGYSSDPVLANYRDYGFRGRVAKPYELAEFGRVLREVSAGK